MRYDPPMGVDVVLHATATGKAWLATLPEEETSLAVRCPKEERDELVLAEPGKFWIADHEAQFAWVRARLAALEDEDELRDVLADSWRQAAPQRLLEAYPDLGVARDG